MASCKARCVALYDGVVLRNRFLRNSSMRRSFWAPLHFTGFLDPTLRVGTHGATLCVAGKGVPDAERRGVRSHAERGNEGLRKSLQSFLPGVESGSCNRPLSKETFS